MRRKRKRKRRTMMMMMTTIVMRMMRVQWRIYGVMPLFSSPSSSMV